MMKLNSFFKGRTYENQVIVIICLLAVMRVAAAIVEDMIYPERTFFEILTDIGIFLLFVVIFLRALKGRRISSVHPALGLIIIALIAHNFIQFGGVMGSTRFTYFGGLFFIGMAYSNRNLYVMMGVQYLLLIIMLEMQVVKNPFQQYLFSRNAVGYTDFIFALISMTVMASFLREATKNEFLRMGELSEKLVEDVKKSRVQNRELMEQSAALLHAQEQLEAEVKSRTEKIQNQNAAIEQFIRYNTDALIEPQKKLAQVIETLRGDSDLHQFMKMSSDELEVVVNGIRQTILSDENLDRQKIKPHE